MRQGYTGTGVKQIVETASAPFASLYHFFPGGKEELGAEVIRWSGQLYGQLIDVFYASGDDPVASTKAFFAGAADHLRETDYADACPIATVALEVSSTSEPLREACADVFEAWTTELGKRLRSAGLPRKRSRDVALSLISLLEGAFVLARATRSTEPLDAAGASASALVRDAMVRRRDHA